ncbi:hypothetical protein ACFTY8_32505 [Streptomyces mirabilis]|uniref:hypothetical protein n=1 Tax=Streptomyces mirabilis TaxID=68239 RepID=UPI0036341578
MNNDKRTEFAMVVIAAVVVGMIAVAYPASIPVIGVVAAVVALPGLAEALTAAWP